MRRMAANRMKLSAIQIHMKAILKQIESETLSPGEAL
jgi:hypothetical protein